MTIEIAKQFARNGIYVFPMYGKELNKPYGWTGKPCKNDEHEAKAIHPTIDLKVIESWSEDVRNKYNTELSGYGVLGRGDIIIFDIDVKDGKPGLQSYAALKKAYNIPQASLIVRSKSGGVHLYFKRPKQFANIKVKSVANSTIGGVVYEGLDIRGDGGHVVGPVAIGEWKEGVYTIVRGSPDVELTEAPVELVRLMTAASVSADLDAMIGSMPEKAMDTRSILARGELPDVVEAGERNESFFIFLNALNNKNIPRSFAKEMALKLKERTEDLDTFDESVNIDDMLDRIYSKEPETPADMARDLINYGLYQVTDARAKVCYIILEDNPYIASRGMHDLANLTALLEPWKRLVTMPSGKSKLVNPAELVAARIGPNQRVGAVGFMPGAADVFELSGTRYLNTYRPLDKPSEEDYDPTYFDMFQLLVSRLFGAIGSDDYDLAMDFCAWTVQHPNLKPVIAPLILSRNRGVGKSLFLEVMTRLHGRSKNNKSQCKILRLDDIGSRFFDPTGSVLNIIDEVQFSIHRNTRQETSHFWRNLKNLITAKTMTVEIKGGAVLELPNTAALIMAGNSGNHFPVEEFDRRIWIVDANAPKMAVGTVDPLYDMIKFWGLPGYEQLHKKILDSIRYGLANHRISNDLTSISAPMTEIKHDMWKASMTDREEWLHTYFEDATNLLAASPIISVDMFVYLMQVSDQVYDERWRDEAEAIFRDAKRKNVFQPIRSESDGRTRGITSIPKVTRNGEIIEQTKRTTLYTTRDHGSFDGADAKTIQQAVHRNLNTIAKWKRSAVTRGDSFAIVDPEEALRRLEEEM